MSAFRCGSGINQWGSSDGDRSVGRSYDAASPGGRRYCGQCSGGRTPDFLREVIDGVAATLSEATDCAMSTAAHPIDTLESFLNPNVVKVEVDANHRAMTFSRAPIPWPRDAFKGAMKTLPSSFRALHHIGIYAYRVSFLKVFPTIPRAPIEATESLEQLRAMWNGFRVAVLELKENLPAGVDTLEDLDRVRSLWKAL